MNCNQFDIASEYRTLTDHFPNHGQRPVIGIAGNSGEHGCELARTYYRSVELGGGIPVIIPPTDNSVMLASLLDHLDGILLSGGGDINPLYWGQDPMPGLRTVNPERDGCELLLTRMAADRNIPLFGICRGIQVLAAALGGEIHQDLETCLPPGTRLIKHMQDAPRHAATHRVQAEEGSTVAALLGSEFAVNSFHHQAVSEPGPHLRVTARSADGIAEAVESCEGRPVMGVQWHPESFLEAGDRTMLPLFRHFVEQAATYRTARTIHRAILTLDSHVDTPTLLEKGTVRLDQRSENGQVDLHRLTEGGVDAVVMAAYLPQGGRSADELAEATQRAEQLITLIQDTVHHCNGATLAVSPKTVFQAKNVGKKAVLIGIENGYALGQDLANVERFRRMGVVYLTLCHNGDNDLCDSARNSRREHGGLSDFGREVIAEMNRTGLMIDLSHASEETFYATLQASNSPVVCSHSSARALCNHPRNLTDDQLRALAASEGVAQVTFYDGFLHDGGGATIDDAVRHILHMIDVAGIDHVGIGSDFDGDGGVTGLASEADMTLLTCKLLAEGLNAKSLRKLWGGNFIRVMSQVQYKGCVQL